MPLNRYHSQTGFTLLELVLVLFLVGLLASAGLLFTENQQDQAYFDETQRRIDIIRKAIIQSGERTVNGQPELNGFVVDNGRLPYCLAELTGPEFAFTDSVSAPDSYYQSPCSSNTALVLLKPNQSSANGIRSGWRGPYIQVQTGDGRSSPFSDDFNRPFLDGYSNDDNSLNYGWNWTLAESQTPTATPPTLVDIESYTPSSDPFPEYLTVQSSGYDLTITTDDYPSDALLDYLVVPDDWLTHDTFSVQLVNTSASSAIENINSGDEVWTLTLSKSAAAAESYDSTFSFTPTTSSIPPNMGMHQQNTSFTRRIPAGYYLVDIACEDADGSGDNCPVMQSTAYTVKLLPRQQIAPLRWNVTP